MTKINEVRKGVDLLTNSPKQGRRKMNRRTKKIGIAVIGILMTVTLVSAGILPFFGEMNITANVQQSVVWGGEGNWQGWEEPIEFEVDVTGGCQYCDKTKIWNRCECDGGWLDITTDIWGPGGPEGVEVNQWHLPGDWTITLDNKDPITWLPIDDEYIIELTYSPCCPAFVWSLEGKVVLPNTEYVLVYYADQPDRIINWGWVPLTLATVTSDANGDISASGSTGLGDTSFPFEEDWNIGPDANYHTSDGYNHARGAKIWLIPASDYDNIDQMTDWNPENYMFETDLVVYFDCDILPIPWIAKAYFEEVYNYNHEFPYYIGAEEKICLVYCACFDWEIMGGVYDIRMRLIPTIV